MNKGIAGLPIYLDEEIEVLSSLDKNDYLQHFEKCSVELYMDST
jgi:hypothetical protein